MKPFVRRFLPELGLTVFCIANLVWMAIAHGWEALPVHFIFVSVSIVYGLRMWNALNSVLALFAVVAPIFVLTLRAIEMGSESQAELAEIPLMSLIFLVMVWHVRERQLVVERGRALFDNASHELLTPLTIARGELELLGATGTCRRWTSSCRRARSCSRSCSAARCSHPACWRSRGSTARMPLSGAPSRRTTCWTPQSSAGGA